MPATPAEVFERNISYAHGLIRGGTALTHIQAGALDPADLYRAAWTQSVSAFDHWLHKEIYERVPKLARLGPQARPRRLDEVALPFALVDRIQNDNKEVGGVLAKYLETKISRTSFHQPRSISEAVQYVVQLEHGVIWRKLAERLGARRGGIWSQSAMINEHQRVLDRRNEIAHSADLDPATNERRPMDEVEASTAVRWMSDLSAVLTDLMDDGQP